MVLNLPEANSRRIAVTDSSTGWLFSCLSTSIASALPILPTVPNVPSACVQESRPMRNTPRSASVYGHGTSDRTRGFAGEGAAQLGGGGSSLKDSCGSGDSFREDAKKAGGRETACGCEAVLDSVLLVLSIRVTHLSPPGDRSVTPPGDTSVTPSGPRSRAETRK